VDRASARVPQGSGAQAQHVKTTRQASRHLAIQCGRKTQNTVRPCQSPSRSELSKHT
jgi:hypothetical protein